LIGPESFTPDHKPLIGPQPGVVGFFNACGCNSMGIMLGGGLGREVTNWIVEGSPSIDLFSFDVSRFHPDSVNSSKFVFERTHESYAKTYAIPFLHDEHLAGRRIDGVRKSFLYEELAKRGCIFQSRHGFERPGWFLLNKKTPQTESGDYEQIPKPYDFYGAYREGGWRLSEGHADVEPHPHHLYNDVIEGELTFDWPKAHDIVALECQAARNGVAIFDQSYFGKFYITGEDSLDFMQYLCGADLKTKADGSVTYTVLCNERGGVEADLTVTKLAKDQGFYLSVGGNTATKDKEWIHKVIDIFHEKKKKADEETTTLVNFYDASDEMAILSVQGPHVRHLLQPMITYHCPNSSQDLPFNLEDDEELPFSFSRSDLKLNGEPIELCLRLTFVGELGYELHVKKKHAVSIYNAIRDAGEVYELNYNNESRQNKDETTHSVLVRDAGYRAIDTLSAEKNFRHWHADLSNRDTPFEAGIGFTVLSKLKNCDDDFMGRKALEVARANGLQRKLVCLVLPPCEGSDQEPLHGTETIWRNDKCVGFVKSTAFGHSLGRTVAYGYVDCPSGLKKITNKWLTEEGVKWAIGNKGKTLEAEIHLKAPFDPKNLRINGTYEE